MSLPALNLSIFRLSKLSLSTSSDCKENKKRNADGQKTDPPVGVEQIIEQFLGEYEKALKTVRLVSDAARLEDVEMRDKRAIQLADQYGTVVMPENVFADHEYANILNEAVADVKKGTENALRISIEQAKPMSQEDVKAAFAAVREYQFEGPWKSSADVEAEMEKLKKLGQQVKASGEKMKSFLKMALTALFVTLRTKSEQLKEMEEKRKEMEKLKNRRLKRAQHAIDMFTGYMLVGKTNAKFSDACALFAEYANTYSTFSFSIQVLASSYGGKKPGCDFEIHGMRWLQDFEFQRVLMRLNTETESRVTYRLGEQPSFTTNRKELVMKLELPFRPLSGSSPEEIAKAAKSRDLAKCMHDGYVERVCYLMAVEIASRRVRNWICGREIAYGPVQVDGKEQIKIPGWNMPIPFASHSWAKSLLTRIANTPNAEGNQPHMPVLIARRLLTNGYTRKLSIIIQKGQVGVRGKIVQSEIVEFGLGRQTCNNMDNALEYIVTNPSLNKRPQDNAMRTLYTSTINLTQSRSGDLVKYTLELEQRQRLIMFREKEEKKVALILWGGHARVLFKCNAFPRFRIVDPWKPEERVRVPFMLYDILWSDDDVAQWDISNPENKDKLVRKDKLVWVKREPEQSNENSCFMVATMRAMVIACAASSENHTDADLLQAAQQPPSEGMAPLCAAIATLARNLTIIMKKSSSHPYTEMELFEETETPTTFLDEYDEPALPAQAVPAPVPAQAVDSDPDDDVPLNNLLIQRARKENSE